MEHEMRQKVGAFERVLTLRPAFDQRHPEPSKNYGIHGMDLRCVLIGPKGATQFVVYTGMHLLHIYDEWERKPPSYTNRPIGADIGYHADEPQYEGQGAQDNCEYRDGRPCYYDGTSLGADEFLPTFLSGGLDAVWPKLEEVYVSRFGQP